MATDVVSREPYVGEKYKQVREGYGVYTYDNQFFRYEGEWKNGKKHGHGKLILGDGTFYEGEFQNGEITGHGYKYFALTGNTYSGQFEIGELHGQGVMTYANGDVYQGQWSHNKRQGHGVLRQVDGSVYQGYYHNHKRHGEGTQIYSNGDRYDGDWVNDKRQGHGEVTLSDNTIYDGQWRNDLYHGYGKMVHSSGMTYEGLWVSGFPEKMATKLSIPSVSSPLEIIQGQSFDIEVTLVTDDGQPVEENGRELRITAGYRYQPDGRPTTKENTAGLFDVIEDVEEKPIPTPFGYSVISYPLTDVYNPDEVSPDNVAQQMSRSRTDLTDSQVPENEEAVFGSESQDGQSSSKEQTTSKVDSDQNKAESSKIGEEGALSSEPTSSDLPGREGSIIGITLPPPVSTKKTQNGSVTFSNLTLTAAPPMYKPFIEGEDGKSSRASQGKTSRRSSKLSQDEKPGSRAKRLGDERFSPPATPSAGSNRSADSGSPVNGSTDDVQCLYAEPGEYVIIVEDVTNPAFLGVSLEPAFLLVKVVLPKKTKRKTTGTSTKGPRWDTSHHINEAATKSRQELAQHDFQDQLKKLQTDR